MVRIGALELLGRRYRPLLEAEPAVLVDIELGKGLAARLVEFLEGDPAVLVLVGAAEPLLLAALLAGLRRLVGRRAAILLADRGLGRGRNRIVALGPAHPQEETGPDQKQSRCDPGDETKHAPCLPALS